MIRSGIFIVGILLFTNTFTLAQSHKPLRKGDFFYDKKQFEPAEKAYRDAAALDSKKPEGSYNTGNALYRQGRYDDAAQHYQTTASHPNVAPGMQADALYNMGNCLLKQQKYKDAETAFENSLRIRPGDAQAKVNLQFAKKKREEQEQQEQQQQQQQQQNKDQQQNQQDQQQNKQQQKEQQNQQQRQQEQREQQQKQQQQLSRAEARRLLETAIGPEDRKTAKKYKQQQQSAAQKPGEKDW